MADQKTLPTDVDPAAFVDEVLPARRRDEARVLLALFGRVTGLPAAMWGPSIVGYGRYAYRYGSGHSGEYFLTGFSPRKAAMTVYVMPGFGAFPAELARLGPHRHSVSCLYLSDLRRIDLAALEEIISGTLEWMKARYDWSRK